jgi:excisionase family DNA binding protein
MSTVVEPVAKKLLNRREAAELLGLTVGTLAVWAFQGRGPAFVKVGRSVRYRVGDIEAFVEQGRKTTREQS